MWRLVPVSLFCSCLSFAGVAQPDVPSFERKEQTLNLALVDGVLPLAQRFPKAMKGDLLRWRITSNTAGEFHLHAYRLSAKINPGETAELVFTAFATGRFRLEWHGRNDPPAAAGHHAAPLAVLEVRPN